MNQKNEQLLAAIQGIHEAGLQPDRWPAVLAQVAALVDSEVGTVWIHDFKDGSATIDGQDGNLAAFVGIDDNALGQYATHFSAVNVWTAREDRYPSGSVVTSSMLYPDASLRRTEFFGDWLHPQDLFYALGSIVEKQQTRAVKMSFLRSERAGPYTPEHLELLRILMPHVQTAVQVHRRIHGLQRLSATAFHALDALSTGVVLLSPQGAFVHANLAAQRHFRHAGGLRVGAAGQLETHSHATTLRLQHAVRAAGAHDPAGSPPAGVVIKAPSHGGVVALFVTPLQGNDAAFGAHSAVAVFCNDPDVAVAGLAPRLMKVYRMTPAEARLAQALVEGKSLKQFAQERATTLNTVRSQLRNASAKVGAKRQVDLVRAVLTGPAVLHMARPDTRHSNP